MLGYLYEVHLPPNGATVRSSINTPDYHSAGCCRRFQQCDFGLVGLMIQPNCCNSQPYAICLSREGAVRGSVRKDMGWYGILVSNTIAYSCWDGVSHPIPYQINGIHFPPIPYRSHTDPISFRSLVSSQMYLELGLPYEKGAVSLSLRSTIVRTDGSPERKRPKASNTSL